MINNLIEKVSLQHLEWNDSGLLFVWRVSGPRPQPSLGYVSESMEVHNECFVFFVEGIFLQIQISVGCTGYGGNICFDKFSRSKRPKNSDALHEVHHLVVSDESRDVLAKVSASLGH